MQDKESIVISLGGSMIVPDYPDPSFIKNFRDLILKHINNKKFFIITGGGKICRIYQSALSETTSVNKDELDWMGIYSTRFNAELLRLSFDGEAYKEIIVDPSEAKNADNSVVIGAGWKPGCSTDTDAVLIAENINAKKIINISNIDYVYDSDPKLNPNAKKIENLTWGEYRSIITDEWTPGMNLPFDPIASKKAEDLGIEVIFISGKKLEDLDSYFSNGSFTGTTIK